MINVSDEFKASTDNQVYEIKATMTLINGKVIELTTADFVKDSVKFDHATSEPDKFSLGAIVIGQCKFALVNYDDEFSEYDFYDATIRIYVGKQLAQNIEWIDKGFYTVTDSSSPGEIITFSALDDMMKFDIDYNQSTLVYPATLGDIIRDACLCCNVILGSSRFDNGTYLVKTRPDDTNLSFRQVLSYAAQLAGCFTRITTNRTLEIGWYNFSAFETEDSLDGGHFLDYLSGDDADGGNFDDYSNGDKYDGGNFDSLHGYHHIYTLFSHDICTDDTEITGIKAMEEYEHEYDETDEEKAKHSYLYGTDKYALEITGNPLLQDGEAEKVALMLGAKLIGVRFRKLTVSSLTDLSVEAGDVAKVSDRKGNVYNAIISNVNVTVGSQATYRSDAETPAERADRRPSAETKLIIDARNAVRSDLNAYEQSANRMTELLNNSLGLYQTIEELDDGSRIYYSHDKPLLEESRVIYKLTRDGFGISTDGGATYSTGVDSDGNAVLNSLAVHGINADWLVVGTIRSPKGTSYWNLDSDFMSLNGEFRQTQNGNTTIAIKNNGLEIYSWTSLGERAGGMTATSFQEGEHKGKHGISAYCEPGSYIGISHTNTDSTDHTAFMRFTTDKTIQKQDITIFKPVSLNTHALHLGVENANALYQGSTGNTVLTGVEKVRLGAGNYTDSGVSLFSTLDVGRSLITAYGHLDMRGWDIYNARAWSSDARFKENIEECSESALDIIDDITVYSFDYKDEKSIRESGHRRFGVISQDVMDIVPEAVEEVKSKGEGGNESVVYQPKEREFIPLILKAIQELKAENTSLRQEIDALKNEASGVKKEVNSMTMKTNPKLEKMKKIALEDVPVPAVGEIERPVENKEERMKVG